MNINFHNSCKKQDIEVCVIKLNVTDINIVIISIYRSPSGNFNFFFKQLDSTVNLLYSNKTEVIICGDINVNYLENFTKKTTVSLSVSHL